MKHDFYLKTASEQKQFQLKIAGMGLLINIGLFSLIFVIGWEFTPISIGLCVVVLTIVAPFFDVPSMIKNGQLIYYSPLLLGEKEKNGIITIHGGTLFDYYFVIDKELNGSQRTKFIIRGYIDGLLNLIEQYEDSSPNSIMIKGTSYIINERTANKLGLIKTKNNMLQVLILSFNYINLLFSYSISKGKLSFPNLKNINTFEGKLDDLIKRKAYLLRLRKIMS